MDAIPAAMVTAIDLCNFEANFTITEYTKAAITPIKILGTKAIKIAQRLPLSVPGTGTKGENANLLRAMEIVVAAIILDNPNIKPRIAPYLGPIRTAPIITGMWITVADPIKGICGKPKGVNVKIAIIAPIIAVRVRH